MGKIGDLWVKLGLKKQDFDNGINDAKKSTQSFSDKMKGLAPVAKLAWAAVAAAVVKFANDAIKMTQKWGDKWNETMSGINAAYGAFVRGLSSGEGWSELFDNMREAARLAREAQKALDEVFERKTSYSYQEAETEKEIANLQLIMRDSRKSNKERIEAAQKIIELEKSLGEVKKDILKQEASAQRDIFRAQTQMNDEEIDFLVKNYNQNRQVINQSREYLAERARLQQQLAAAQNSYGTGAMSKEAYQHIQDRIDEAKRGLADLEASTSSVVKNIADMTKKYDKSSDELVANMAAAEVAVINIDAEVARASGRATSMLGSLANSGGGVSTPTVEPQAVETVRTLADELAEAGGNVDLLKRKLVDGADLVAAGWKDAGNAIQTIYSQLITTKDANGKEVKVLVSPILPDGSVLSPDLLAEYVSLNLDGAANMLAADKLGIVLQAGVDVDESSQRTLEALVKSFYEGDIAVKQWSDRIREAAELDAMLEQSLQELQESLDADIDAQFEQMLNSLLDEIEAAAERARQLSEEFYDAIISGFSAGCQELADQLFGLKEVNAGAIFAALLTPLADMAVKEGEILIAEGIGVEACKKALESLNGYAAIAAGAALVAIGVAAKAGLQSLAGSGGSSSYATTYTGGGAGSQTQLIETEMTIYVKGEIDGSNILLSGQRTSKDLDR